MSSDFNSTVDAEFAQNWEVKKVFDPEGVQEFTIFSLELNGQELWEYRPTGKIDKADLTQRQRHKITRAERIDKLSAMYKGMEQHELSPFDWGMGRSE